MNRPKSQVTVLFGFEKVSDIGNFLKLQFKYLAVKLNSVLGTHLPCVSHPDQGTDGVKGSCPADQ